MRGRLALGEIAMVERLDDLMASLWRATIRRATQSPRQWSTQVRCCDNRAVVLAGAACIIAGAALCGTDDREYASHIGGLDVDCRSLALGVIRTNDSLSFEVRIGNRGEAPLTGFRIAPGCGCTTVSQVPETLQPGERVVVQFHFRAGELIGKIAKPLYFDWQRNGDSFSERFLITAEVRESATAP